MSETLLIHYNIEDAQQATWSTCNDEGELTGKISTGTLEELSAAEIKRPAVILLNSQCLHINQLTLPTQNLQKMLKAVPYAIEEYIAEDIENFHFVITNNKNDKTTSVVGIDKTTLKNIVSIFNDANINVEKIIPDALCLAADENSKQWACLHYEDNTYLQTGKNSGMLFSHNMLPYIINSKLQDETQTPPEKILLFSEQDKANVFDQLISETLAEHDNIEHINIAYNTHPLVVFCGQYKQALPLNLLQRSFKPKSKSSGYWQHWKLAASLGIIWLTLNLGLTGFQFVQISEQNNITKAKIENIYKKTFPESTKIVNPRVQMEQKLNELKGGSGNSENGLIFLLAESFGTLSMDKENITLQSLNFRNSRMDIGLQSSNLQSIETLNSKLNKNNKIKSEIVSSSSEKDKVKGNLRIEGRS